MEAASSAGFKAATYQVIGNPQGERGFVAFGPTSIASSPGGGGDHWWGAGGTSSISCTPDVMILAALIMGWKGSQGKFG